MWYLKSNRGVFYAAVLVFFEYNYKQTKNKLHKKYSIENSNISKTNTTGVAKTPHRNSKIWMLYMLSL